MARHRVFRLPIVRGVMALGESLAIGFRALAISANYARSRSGRRRGRGRHRALARRAHLRVRDRDRLRDRRLQGGAGADHRSAADPSTGEYFVHRRGADPRLDLRRLPLAHLAAARPAPRLPVPRGRAQGDQRLRGGRAARARDRAALLAHPSALRDGVPALGDGDRGLRVRVLRPPDLVLADRDADPAAAADRRARVRADPLRRQAPGQPRA